MGSRWLQLLWVLQNALSDTFKTQNIFYFCYGLAQGTFFTISKHCRKNKCYKRAISLIYISSIFFASEPRQKALAYYKKHKSVALQNRLTNEMAKSCESSCRANLSNKFLKKALKKEIFIHAMHVFYHLNETSEQQK